MTNLLIVESPGKIKKLKKILGSNWQVKASMGNFRSLAKVVLQRVERNELNRAKFFRDRLEEKN